MPWPTSHAAAQAVQYTAVQPQQCGLLPVQEAVVSGLFESPPPALSSVGCFSPGDHDSFRRGSTVQRLVSAAVRLPVG